MEANPFYLAVKVVPRQPKTEIIGTMADGTIKIRLKAVPEKGKANAELCRFLAEHYGVPSGNVELLVGSADTRKMVKITPR